MRASGRPGRMHVAGIGILLAALVLAGAGTAAAAGWLGDDGPEGPPPPRTVTIRIHFSRFDPEVVDVEPGRTVRFVIENTDPIDHEFIVGDEVVQLVHERGTEAHHAPRPGEVSVPAGDTVVTTMTFGRGPRALLFGCHLPGHYAFGMRGELRVG